MIAHVPRGLVESEDDESLPDEDVFNELSAVVRAHGREFTTEPADPVVLRRVSARLGLPADFASLYARCGPADRSSIPWTVEDLLVFSFGLLLGAQAGYRWTGPERSPSPLWSADWVVVASIFGDPFFVDTSQSGCPVLFARHGEAGWAPTEVASSMVSFVRALSVFERVLLGDFAGEVFDDIGLVSDFVHAVERELGTVLTEPQVAAFVEAMV